MSGDRHLRRDPEGRLPTGGPDRLATVLVTASLPYAATVAGQHLLQLLVGLLARQYQVIGEILLDIPDCDLHPRVCLAPPISGGSLRSALLASGSAIGGNLVRTSMNDGQLPSVVIAVGEGIDPRSFGAPSIAIWGHGWETRASTERALLPGKTGSPNPIGPYLAATIAAGFAFKGAYGKLAHLDAHYSLWLPGLGCGPELGGLRLPTAHVVGLGAVGAAFGHTLAALVGVRGDVLGIDPQVMSETDRNRLISGTWTTVGESKAERFKTLFAASEVRAWVFKGRWPEDYLGDLNRPVPPDVRQQQTAGQFEWIISCVDRDRDRARIAGMLPRHVLAGSTFGMAAQTAYYSMVGNCECLNCRHRTSAQVGVEELVEQLKRFTKSERDSWYAQFGANPEVRAVIEEYLASPSCGAPGEADLARLGLQGPVDWAVGFVSAAAGVILAARFVRHALVGSVESETVLGSEVRYFFWSDRMMVTRARRAADCPGCYGRDREWAAVWGPPRS